MTVVNNPHNEITITRKEYDQLKRHELAAKMALNLLKCYAEKKWVGYEADLLLAEFGGGFE